MHNEALNGDPRSVKDIVEAKAKAMKSAGRKTQSLPSQEASMSSTSGDSEEEASYTVNSDDDGSGSEE